MTPGVIFRVSLAAVALATAAAPEWTVQTSGVTARLRGVSAVTEQVAWASGENNTILRTADGGATWARVANPAPIDKLDFRDVEAVAPDVAYVLDRKSVV